jgi:hypothetical protein
MTPAISNASAIPAKPDSPEREEHGQIHRKTTFQPGNKGSHYKAISFVSSFDHLRKRRGGPKNPMKSLQATVHFRIL